MSFLDFKDILSISLLNKNWRTIVESESVWRDLCQRTFEEVVGNKSPEGIPWKLYYQMLSNARFKQCASGVELSNHNKTVRRSKMTKEFGLLAIGKPHYSGKHKYSIRIDDATDVGIGIASSKKREELNFEASLHVSEGCCIYYYTGVWYGKTKGTSVTGRGETFRDGDIIDIYFNVKSRKVKIFKNQDKLLLRCRTLEQTLQAKQKKEVASSSMGLGVVLGKVKSKVTIIDYSYFKRFPKEKNRSDLYHLRALETNVLHQ